MDKGLLMAMVLRTTLLAGVLLLAGACGDDDEPAAAAGATAEPAAEAAGDDPDDAGESDDPGGADGVANLGDDLDRWTDGEAASLVPVPDTLRVSRQGQYGEEEPYLAARDEETPKEEVMADIEALLDELGWREVDVSEDGAYTQVRAEHDAWDLDISVRAIEDGAGTSLEGGLSAR
jgi:hypothetical protein